MASAGVRQMVLNSERMVFSCAGYKPVLLFMCNNGWTNTAGFSISSDYHKFIQFVFLVQPSFLPFFTTILKAQSTVV